MIFSPCAAAQFDVDYLESISSRENSEPSSLTRESLFVKFDPLVGKQALSNKTMNNLTEMCAYAHVDCMHSFSLLSCRSETEEETFGTPDRITTTEKITRCALNRVHKILMDAASFSC